MSLTINLYYTGENQNAVRFAEEMEKSGIADEIRREEGNERYEYFRSLKEPQTVLLIDRWKDAQSLDRHHASPMMGKIAALREKYDLHMRAERFVFAEASDTDSAFIRT